MNQAVRIRVDPRLVAPEKAARRLGMTLAAFADIREELERRGFPKPIPVVGNYPLELVDRWIDEKAGLLSDDSPAGAEAAMLRSIANMG